MMDPQLSLSMAARLLEVVGPAIVRGDYENMPFPNEAESTEVWGVSRTVVREAVKSLMAKGLIESRPRIGTHVQPSSKWNLLDADVMRWVVSTPDPSAFLREYDDLRKAIIPMAAGLAADLASASALAAVETAYGALKNADDRQGRLDGIRAFYTALTEASNNAVLIRLHTTMIVAFNRFAERLLSAGAFDPEQYSAVVNAIRAKDIKRAETSMRWLLDDESRAVYLQYVKGPEKADRSAVG